MPIAEASSGVEPYIMEIWNYLPIILIIWILVHYELLPIHTSDRSVGIDARVGRAIARQQEYFDAGIFSDNGYSLYCAVLRSWRARNLRERWTNWEGWLKILKRGPSYLDYFKRKAQRDDFSETETSMSESDEPAATIADFAVAVHNTSFKELNQFPEVNSENVEEMCSSAVSNCKISIVYSTNHRVIAIQQNTITLLLKLRNWLSLNREYLVNTEESSTLNKRQYAEGETLDMRRFEYLLDMVYTRPTRKPSKTRTKGSKRKRSP